MPGDGHSPDGGTGTILRVDPRRFGKVLHRHANFLDFKKIAPYYLRCRIRARHCEAVRAHREWFKAAEATRLSAVALDVVHDGASSRE